MKTIPSSVVSRRVLGISLLMALLFCLAGDHKSHAKSEAKSEEVARGLVYEKIEEWEDEPIVAHILRVSLRAKKKDEDRGDDGKQEAEDEEQSSRDKVARQ